MTLTIIVLLLLSASKTHADDFYRAAVLEYATPYLPLATGDEVLSYNADIYAQYMKNASSQQVDIIVFPEGGLFGHRNRRKYIELPSPNEIVAPCDFNGTFHPALVKLSCASRDFKLYAVINVAEQYFNSNTNKTEFYNSNVAFDRNGTVVGRYRKFNPYGESVTKPAEPDHHYFETDFGVRFGMFICFDIDFLEPGVVMVRDYGIRHFAFPHCWISELPFLTAVQAQWGWAYGMDAVLLASGCNDPLTGGTGTGIYQGQEGALQYFQTNAKTSKLIVAEVSKTFLSDCDLVDYDLDNPGSQAYHEPSNQRYLLDRSESSVVYFVDVNEEPPTADVTGPSDSNTSLAMLRDYMDVYNSQLLGPTDGDQAFSSTWNNTSLFLTFTSETTLCQNEFCCHFQVAMRSEFNSTFPPANNRGDDFTHNFYRLVAFDGVRWYGGGIATGGIQVCGVISCANDSITSCGLRADDSSAQPQKYHAGEFGKLYKVGTVFESISIQTSFFYNNTFVFPDIFVTGEGDSFGALVPSDSFTFEQSTPNNKSLNCSLNIYEPVPNLITAAVYARQIDRDGQKRTELPRSHAQTPPHSIFWIVVLFFVIFHRIFATIL